MISSNSSITHEEYLKRKRKRKLIKYGLVFFIIVSFVATLSYISHRPKIRISEVLLVGGILVTEDDVESRTLEFISGSYLWLFPKNNSILYKHDALENYLKNTFPRIDTIYVHLKDLHTLLVEITERKPQAIWCGGTPNTEDSIPKCFFMDINGTIFAPAPQFSGDAYFKYYGLVTDENPIGKQYLASSTQFVQMTDFVAVTKKISIKPLYIIAKPANEFSLVISGGGEIYFDMKEPLSKASENLEALLRTEPLIPRRNQDLPIQYIDLRYGNKLFYKLK